MPKFGVKNIVKSHQKKFHEFFYFDKNLVKLLSVIFFHINSHEYTEIYEKLQIIPLSDQCK